MSDGDFELDEPQSERVSPGMWLRKNRKRVARLESAALRFSRLLQRGVVESKEFTVEDRLRVLNVIANDETNPKYAISAMRMLDSYAMAQGALSWKALQIREDANKVEAAKAVISLQELAASAENYIQSVEATVVPTPTPSEEKHE